MFAKSILFYQEIMLNMDESEIYYSGILIEIRSR